MNKVNETLVIYSQTHHIITRFGLAISLVFDNATYFSSLKLTKFSLEKGIKIKYISNYYPQGNGLVESTKKNLIHIIKKIKKIVTNHHRNRDSMLVDALWVDKVTPKATLGNSPFFLVYGKEAILPPNIFLPSLPLSQYEKDSPTTTMKHIINTLLNLEEER
jgi:hypothetical protein